MTRLPVKKGIKILDMIISKLTKNKPFRNNGIHILESIKSRRMP